jgi:hypothetical protein
LRPPSQKPNDQVHLKHSESDWRIVKRWQEFASESRVNLIRVVAIGVFYSIQLYQFNFATIAEPQLDAATRFHNQATLLSTAWFAMAIAIWFCLTIRWIPGYLKYITTLGDLILLTAVLSIGAGASSPLTYVYFPIVVLAGLRFDLWLVRVSTVVACICYVGLLALASPDWYGSPEISLQNVSRTTQLIFLTALILTGVTLGQIARRAQVLVFEYHTRIADKSSANHRGDGDD